MVLDRVAKWNRHQKSIGFTNGCFDLIHPGHLSLLSQSRSQCDVLIVGLNSDASIKRLKGPDRPIHDQDARAAVLAALSMVDAVVVFDEDTPEQLIKAIVPHVLIKGADYTEDQVVGGDLVKKAGGRVFLAQLVPGRSTTRTVDKLKG
jgi:D-beta-D-heptose 7-phosphate kinase/D-beta-D-heptose 1-phosphate adenosyltransferase